MAWIASRAKKAEIMDKERMISEKKWQLGSTKGLEKFFNKKSAPAVSRKKTDSENGSASSRV